MATSRLYALGQIDDLYKGMSPYMKFLEKMSNVKLNNEYLKKFETLLYALQFIGNMDSWEIVNSYLSEYKASGELTRDDKEYLNGVYKWAKREMRKDSTRQKWKRFLKASMEKAKRR